VPGQSRGSGHGLGSTVSIMCSQGEPTPARSVTKLVAPATV
jgi:hypothetical protein